MDEEKQAEITREITERYTRQTDVRYAAARLWVDAIIKPEDTRKQISNALECADHNPVIEEFKTGVLQV